MTLCRSIAAYLLTYVFNLVTVCTGALWSMELDGRSLVSGSCDRTVSVFLLDKDRLVSLHMLGLTCTIPYQF